MAALLARTCLKRRISSSFARNELRNVQNKKLITSLLGITWLQYSCYHSTPILLKQSKTVEDKKQLQKLKQLQLINPKKTNKLPVINIWYPMTVLDLVTATERPVDDVLDALFYSDRETVYNVNSLIENQQVLKEAVRKIGLKFRIVSPPNVVKSKHVEEDYDVKKGPPPDPSVLVSRRPVITIMGHVDHGKTTLLDALRKSSIVDSEFGGITQHIGAFNVTLENGQKITFLDTPGHAAFSTMRARGANVTDIVILVVAADDGVMEQTIQSINMAKESKVPIIVAINKIDKPNIDIKRTQQMLAEQGIFVEDLNGDVQSVNISALTGKNLDQLIEAVLAQAEIMNLRGDPTGPVEGVVIEASNDPHRGKLATVLIQRGTLKIKDVLVSGLAWCKVRSMFDDSGTILKQAGLSDAVQIIGWRELPVAGEEILQVKSERVAHLVMKYRQSKVDEAKSIEQKIVADQKNEEHLVEYQKIVMKKRALGVRKLKREGPREKEIKEDNFPKVNIIIKGDVVGSVEALLDVLDTYDDEKRCQLSIVHYGVGPVTETDLEFAKAFNAVIYTFNTKIPKTLSQEIIKENISVHQHTVIYKLIDDLKTEINKKLPLTKVEEVIGEANILQEFQINEKRKKVKVAGCRCTKGVLKKSELFKVVRNGEVIYTGKADSMKHLKNEVEFIKTNIECGIKLEKFEADLKPGDILICYKHVDKMQETTWSPFK